MVALVELLVGALVVYLIALVILIGIGSLVKEADRNASDVLDAERRRRELGDELARRRRCRSR